MDAKFCGVRWPNILRVAGFACSSARRSAAAKSVAASVTTLIMDLRDARESQRDGKVKPGARAKKLRKGAAPPEILF